MFQAEYRLGRTTACGSGLTRSGTSAKRYVDRRASGATRAWKRGKIALRTVPRRTCPVGIRLATITPGSEGEGDAALVSSGGFERGP